MTEPRFTPGPWKVCRSNEDFDGPFYTLDDDDYERPINAIRSKSETIACAHDLFEFDGANANLISAAPDLYEALEDLLYQARFSENQGGWDFEQARAALKKARGEG